MIENVTENFNRIKLENLDILLLYSEEAVQNI